MHFQSEGKDLQPNSQASIEQLSMEKIRTNDPKPSSSSHVSKERQSTDYSKVDSRLEEFVHCFVKEFEAKLNAYNLILEGEAKKVGKFYDAYSGTIGHGIGGALGGLVGAFFGSPVAGARFGAGVGKSGAEKLADAIGSEHHRKKATNLVKLVSLSRKDKAHLRQKLVEAACDVFQSFEMQFMRVTTSDQGPKRAMQLLAKDAANRAIDYLGKKEDAFITEAVISGKSKIEPVVGVHIPSSHIKPPGLEINYEYKSFNEKWRTASLYEKVGLTIEGKIPTEAANYYGKMNGGRSEKYGYRRLFTSESWNQLQKEYKSSSVVESRREKFTGYEYVLNSKDSDQKAKAILEKINEDDKDLREERITKVIEEAKSDIMEVITNLKEESNSCRSEDRKLLKKIEKNLKTLKIEEYLEIFKQSFQEVKQGQRKIVKSIEASRKENTENFDELSLKQDIYHDGDKREHKKTQKGIERVEERIESNSEITKEIHKAVTQKSKQEEGPVCFDLKAPVKQFEGRTEILSNLHKKFQSISEKAISRIVSISGTGGVGKTQLARKYAYDHKNDYDGNVMWINAESYHTLARSFIRLARKLGIVINASEDQLDLQFVVQDVYEFFDKRKCLFIFDNAEKNEELEPFLPVTSSRNERTRVLITSRIVGEAWKQWEVEGITLDEFSDEEAINFVRKNLEIDGGDDSQDDKIKKLAIDVLYRFPLNLGQAVAYIKEETEESRRRGEGKYTIVTYLEEYEEKKKMLLNNERFKSLLNDYKYTTLTTWMVTADKIKDDKENGELALKILDIIAYFAPNSIPVKTFFLNLEIDVDKVKLWAAVDDLLNRYSIIKLDNGEADIHQLVQEVMRINIADTEREEETLRTALKFIKDFNVGKTDPEPVSPILKLFFYRSTKADLLSNVEMHAASVWRYICINAGKYSQLVKDYYGPYGENGNTPINLLAMTGDIKAIQSVLENVKEVELLANDYNAVGNTPIHSAAFNGHKNVVRYFLETQRVDVNIGTKDAENTPLTIAILGNHLDVVKYLIEKKADPNDGGKFHIRPIYIAASYGRKDILEYLVPKINILVRSEGGHNVLHFALLHLKQFSEHSSDVEEIVKYLLEKNSNLVKCEELMGVVSPLHLATECNSDKIVEMFLDFGADVNAKTSIDPPTFEDPGIQFLYRLDYNYYYEGFTPLHIAAKQSHLKIVKLLLKHGAIYDNFDVDTRTPFDIAEPESEVANLLVCIDRLFKAVQDGEKDEVDCLLEGNDSDVLEAILNARNRAGETLMDVARCKRDKDIENLLSEKLKSI